MHSVRPAGRGSELKMSTELEDNGTLLEDIVTNETNMTGRGAATPQGIALTYASLFLMALGPIVLGALRSVHYHSGLKVSVAALNDCVPCIK